VDEKIMDFSNRNAQTPAPAAGHSQHPTANTKRQSGADGSKWGRIGVVLAAVAVAVLLIGVIVIGLSNGSGTSKAEDTFVDSNKLQAVFLNTGQVYFGNIKELNNKYLVVTGIYYLQTAGSGSSTTSTSSDSNVSLVKLGCELHEPYDQMVINRDQVTFWENLNDGGQVAKAVSTFKKDNPQGQKCSDQSSSASTNGSSSVQNAGSANKQ
jgi:hypothetical protein